MVYTIIDRESYELVIVTSIIDLIVATVALYLVANIPVFSERTQLERDITTIFLGAILK